MPSGGAFIGARLRRALLVGGGVAAVSLALASGALASTMIGNTPPWNGSPIISGFGYGQPCCTATYGQTVTVPATDTTLHSFTFYVQLPTNLTFRGEVYAWDPTTGNPANNTSGNATGPALYESGPMHTTSYNGGIGPFEPITFKTGGINLTAGAQYVLFFTISRDYAADAPAAGIPGFAGYTATDTYSGGDFVFLNNGGDTSQWTTTPWSNLVAFGADDLAFTASFSPPPPGSKVLSWSPVTSPGSFEFGTVSPGGTASQVFTLKYSGGGDSDGLQLKITLTGSAAFTKTAGTCTHILRPHRSCTVTVQYAPAGAGHVDTGTLTATGTGEERRVTAKLNLAGAVAKATPGLATVPGPGGPPGTTVTDAASLTGGQAPTGTIEFRLYGPSPTASCTGTPVDDETVAVSGDGNYGTPAGATLSQPGTYWWTAAYNGDSSNNPVSSGCALEPVTIGP
jgi:hypothetical protein